MGSVSMARACASAAVSRVLVFGIIGLSVSVAVGCGSSSSPAVRGYGGSANGSGGSTAPGQGGSGDTSSQGGSSAPSQGGASTGSGGSSSGGTTNASGGAASGGAMTSNGGTSTGSGGDTSTGNGGVAGACQMATYKFEPKIPTLYVMVDRSGSMFDCLSTKDPETSCKTPEDTAWVKLKTAALSVINSMQADVRFGFAAFTGTQSGMCPVIDQVEPALNNHAAIKTKYDSLPFQPENASTGTKFETPARASLDLIGDKLLKDTTPGDKFILFVTDGQPDYCDDSNSLCAPDSVIAGLQALKAKNITTVVMGLQYMAGSLAPGVLQAFTNAGLGEATVAPLRTAQDTSYAFYDECNSIAGWHADLVASGKTAERGVTLGTYSATAGPTKPLAPSASDQAMIVSVLQKALSGVKSCTFDLSNVGSQAIKVNLNKLAEASVLIENKNIAQSDMNGWSMASATQLLLNGTACDTWRNPDNNKIDFNFPCNTIIFE